VSAEASSLVSLRNLFLLLLPWDVCRHGLVVRKFGRSQVFYQGGSHELFSVSYTCLQRTENKHFVDSYKLFITFMHALTLYCNTLLTAQCSLNYT